MKFVLFLRMCQATLHFLCDLFCLERRRRENTIDFSSNQQTSTFDNCALTHWTVNQSYQAAAAAATESQKKVRNNINN
jgi:hypothetical protein